MRIPRTLGLDQRQALAVGIKPVGVGVDVQATGATMKPASNQKLALLLAAAWVVGYAILAAWRAMTGE